MEFILVDCGLVATPNYAENGDELSDIIERVSHFAFLAATDWPLKLIMSTRGKLALADHYPHFEGLYELLEVMEVSTVYTARDLFVSYLTLLQRCLDMDEHGIPTVNGVAGVQINPALPHVHPAELLEHSRLDLISAVLNSEKGTGCSFSPGFATADAEQIHVAAEIVEISASDESTQAMLPMQLDGHTRVARRLRDLAKEDYAFEIWRRAQTADDIWLALLLGAMDFVGGNGILPSFRIGSQFMTSLQHAECASVGKHASVCFSKCIQIIAGSANVDSKPFLEGTHSSKQRQRSDGALAWRTHVTKGHQAIRLMHWTVSGIIELANVGNKHDLEIEVGNASALSFEIFPFLTGPGM